MKSILSFPLIKDHEDLKILLKEYFLDHSKETGITEEYFRNFYAPFSYSLKRIMDEPFNPLVTSSIIDQNYDKAIVDEIFYKIREVVSNTLLTELNINRLSGSLVGDTSEERYLYFDDEILGNEDGFFEILEEYPEILSLIVLKMNQILEEQFNILTNIVKDYNDIKCMFFQNKDFIVEGYKFGLGDPHNNGKSVKIIETNLGKFVYKPKFMNIERNFNKVLNWINSKSDDPNQHLKYPEVICKQGYGWQQYIRNRELQTLESAHHFYYKQGMNIAVMYILNAGDFHYENVIADESDPVLIDIETFFSNIEPIEGDELTKSYQTSVLSTMMLPMDYGKFMDFEISGLSGKEGQVSELYSSLNLINRKSDDMQFVNKPFILDGKRNIPIFMGQKIEAMHYIDDICNGFAYGYNVIKNAKDEFSELIDIFINDTIRVVLRPTQTYSEFLTMSKYPKYLVSQEKRKELFQLLLEYPSEKFTTDIINEEIKSLENEDVPYFYTSIGSTFIKINHIQKDDYFGVSPLDSAKAKIELLSDDDLKFQAKIIRLSLGFELSKTDVDTKYIDPEPLLKIYIHDKLEMKKQIEYWTQDILEKSTRLQSGRIQWFSHITDGEQKAKLGYMLYGLYDGITGMAILFALLSKFIDSEKYEHYYSLLMDDLVENEHKLLEYENNLCGFGNTGSVIYTYLYLGKLRNDAALISKAVELAEKFSEKIVSTLEIEDIEIDFASGISSLLVILCRVHTESKSEKLMPCIRAITNYIIKELEKQIINKDYRTGFAHGYSGITYALKVASSHTDIPLNMIEELIRFENKKYDSQTDQWYDTRKNDNKYVEDYWCQGSVGMYSSRMEMRNEVSPESLMLDPLKKNSEKSIQRFTNYSLCHGYIGNFLLLNHVGALPANYFYLPKSWDDYVGGLGAHAESIGLFLGEAGLVYFLISMLGNDIPNILYLEV
ncbi:type 2 lanthipeptide synthetase LanM [Paenibacillus faecalis]|uniref:type 2 lanthipeptide synthetase LanM n=1 Tax=Paenibacillus faecalis TaxID=2079532 RepID=UPI000D0E6EBD|nr:type 2 lanthipeptide synthetase LanM [Paenibacillus faecalis]